MKIFFKTSILLKLLLLISCSTTPEPINFETELINRNNLYYTRDTNKPYSGPVFALDYKGRNIKEGILENGKMIDFNDIEWSNDGNVKYVDKYNSDDKKDGLWKLFYSDDSRGEINFNNNKMNGVLRIWHKNGKKSAEGFYKMGESDGIFSKWFDDGTKWSEEVYKNGKKIKS